MCSAVLMRIDLQYGVRIGLRCIYVSIRKMLTTWASFSVRNCVATTLRKYWNIYWALVVYLMRLDTFFNRIGEN